MKRPFLLLFLVASFTFTMAQKGVNKKDMVGFGCYKGETQTESVSKALSYLKNSEYQELIKMLDSKKRSERFLAVLLLEKLETDSIITLEDNQRQKIKLIYDSKQKVSFCGGCIYWDRMSLNEALKKDSKPRKLTIMSLERIVN